MSVDADKSQLQRLFHRRKNPQSNSFALALQGTPLLYQKLEGFTMSEPDNV